MAQLTLFDTPQALSYTEQREGPLRRIAEHRTQELSDAEILACLLGTSTTEAQRILEAFDGWFGLLQADYTELCALHGISRVRAGRIKAGLEIGRRLLLVTHRERFQIKSPTDVVQLMQLEMSHLDQEQLRVIALDTKNRVLKITTVYIGSLNSALVRVGELFKDALKRNACAIIALHNHPSGDPTPSPEDVLLTRNIYDAGKMLDCELTDHIIIGQGRFVSLKERGLGFPK